MTRGTSGRGRRTTAAAGLAALLALAGAGGAAGLLVPRAVEAAWVQESQVEGSFAAAVVPAASFTAQCRYYPAILGIGARVEISWAAPTGYTVSDAVLRASTAGPGSPMTELSGSSTTSVSGGYVTTVSTSSLTGRTGATDQADVAIALQHQSGWESQPIAVRVDLGLLSLGAGCQNL